MTVSLPTPRPLAAHEGTYTAAELAPNFAQEVADFLPEIEWYAATLAGVADLPPAVATVATELLASARRCAELAEQLQQLSR